MIKIAIVGVGNIARGTYLPFLTTQEDVSLGYYNRTPEKAEEAARQFGGDAFTSMEELAAWQPDTVFLLTRETSRYEAAMEVLSRGAKRLFCEKPLTAARGQAHVVEEDFHRGKEVIDLARQKRCEVGMIFNYRFFDHTLLAKKIAAERHFGQVTEITGQVHYACWSHCIDLVHHFSGEIAEMTALSGQVEREGQGFQACDVTAAFRCSSGAVGTLIGTAGMKWQHPLFELVFTFENGRIHMRDLDGDLEVLDGSTQQHECYSMARDRSRGDHYNASFGKSLTAYLHSIRHEEEAPVTGIDGLRELQVEAAIKRSIAEKRPVLVQEELPL